MHFSTLASLALTSVLTASAVPTKRQSYGATPPSDADILQFALTLEHLENVFYKQALSTMTPDQFVAAGFSADFYTQLQYVATDEEQHVTFLESALSAAGATPVKACKYNFGDISDPMKFVSTAATVEGVGVSAYLGAAPGITSKTYLTAAGAILVTEALHQSAERGALGEIPMANVFGTPLGLNAVYSIASAFITSCPDDNASLPVMKYPGLTLNSGNPTSTEGAMVDLVPETMPSGSFFATFVSGLEIIPVVAEAGSDGMIMVQVPMNVSGQSYVFLTKDNSAMVTDDTVLAGPVILEVTPQAPSYNLNIQ